MEEWGQGGKGVRERASSSFLNHEHYKTQALSALELTHRKVVTCVICRMEQKLWYYEKICSVLSQ